MSVEYALRRGYEPADSGYQPVSSCPSCAGTTFQYFWVKKSIRAYCEGCGFNRSVPLLKNLKKRTNTTLTHWSTNVKAKYGWRCARCGSEERVEAHHIKPVSIAPELKYNVDNGIALCHTCHRRAHGWSVKEEE